MYDNYYYSAFMHLCNKLEYMQTTHSKYTQPLVDVCSGSVLWCGIFTIICGLLCALACCKGA